MKVFAHRKIVLRNQFYIVVYHDALNKCATGIL